MRWASISGWLYEVSERGHVRSLRTGQTLRPQALHNGYHLVVLYKDSVRYPRLIHRLVASAFITNPENKPQINHKDFIRHHNVVCNLEWATVSENIRYSVRA